MNYYKRTYKDHPDNPAKNNKKLNWNTESNISLSRYIKYYNNMEPKKKINWLKIWQIVRDLLVAILTGDAIMNKV